VMIGGLGSVMLQFPMSTSTFKGVFPKSLWASPLQIPTNFSVSGIVSRGLFVLQNRYGLHNCKWAI
jgi:hypothetical protein